MPASQTYRPQHAAAHGRRLHPQATASEAQMAHIISEKVALLQSDVDRGNCAIASQAMVEGSEQSCVASCLTGGPRRCNEGSFAINVGRKSL